MRVSCSTLVLERLQCRWRPCRVRFLHTKNTCVHSVEFGGDRNHVERIGIDRVHILGYNAKLTRCVGFIEEVAPSVISFVKRKGALVFLSWTFVGDFRVVMAGVGWSSGVDVTGVYCDYRIVVYTRLCQGCRLRTVADIVVAGAHIGGVDGYVTGAGWPRYW